MKELHIDYRYLKAFMVTAELLNFSKAAQELGIAQSAVSRQVKLLEDSLKHQLIIRSSKKVILTEKGEWLLSVIKNFESEIVEGIYGAASKKIKIGILHGLLENWFVDLVTEYIKQQHHQLLIEINPLETLKEKLLNGRYDMVFTTEDIQSELVSSLKLFEEKMVLISKTDINPKNASQYPWIVYNENDHLFHLHKKRSEQVVAVNSITSIVTLVKKGAGIAIVPSFMVKNQESLFQYDVKSLPRHDVHISTLNFMSMPAHLKTLVDLIKKHMSSMGK
jgi:DNA-binding transcriptional LysR family regulator